MSDINAIIAALTAGNQTIQKENPYNSWGDLSSQIGQLAIKSAGPEDAGKAALLAGLSGLFGGAMTGLGANYNTSRQGAYQSALIEALGINGVATPATEGDNLNSNLAADVNRQSQLIQMQQLLADRSSAKDSDRKLLEMIQGEKVKRALGDQYFDDDLEKLRRERQVMAETKVPTSAERVVEDPVVRRTFEKIRAKSLGIELPEDQRDFTPEELATLGQQDVGVQRMFDQLIASDRVQGRHGDRIEQTEKDRAAKNQTLVFPGYVVPDSPNIPRPQESEVVEERQRIAGMEQVMVAADRLASNNDLSLFGSGAVDNKVTRALLTEAMKGYTGRGARVSNEQYQAFESAMQPILAGNPIDTVISKLTVRDQQAFATVLKDMMQSSIDKRIETYGGLRRNKSYSANEIDTYKLRFGLTDEQIVKALGITAEELAAAANE